MQGALLLSKLQLMQRDWLFKYHRCYLKVTIMKDILQASPSPSFSMFVVDVSQNMQLNKLSL